MIRVFLFFVLSCYSLFAVNRNDLVITEVMFDPSAVSDSNGEYFEIYNRTTSPINLINWTLKDDGSNTHTINISLQVPPESYIVLGKSSDKSINGGINVDYVYSNFTLHNTSDEIVLFDELMNEISALRYISGQWTESPKAGRAYELNDLSGITDLIDPTQSQYEIAIDQNESGDYGSAGTIGGGMYVPPEIPLVEVDITETHNLIEGVRQEVINQNASVETNLESSLTGKTAATQALITAAKEEILTAIGNISLGGGEEPEPTPVQTEPSQVEEYMFNKINFGSLSSAEIELNITSGTMTTYIPENHNNVFNNATYNPNVVNEIFVESVEIDGVHTIVFELEAEYTVGDGYYELVEFKFIAPEGTAKNSSSPSNQDISSGLNSKSNLGNGSYTSSHQTYVMDGSPISQTLTFTSSYKFIMWY